MAVFVLQKEQMENAVGPHPEAPAAAGAAKAGLSGVEGALSCPSHAFPPVLVP